MPFLHGELDRVQVVAQRPAQRERILLHALQQLFVVRRRVLHVALVVRPARIVGHDVDLLLPHHVAAEILIKIDGLLVHHAQVARLVVGLEKLLAVVDVVTRRAIRRRRPAS